MVISQRNLPMGEHLDNISFRIYLCGLKKGINAGNYAGLQKFVGCFQGEEPGDEIEELGKYGVYCHFENVSVKLFGGISKTLEVMRLVDKDLDAKKKTLRFLDDLIHSLEAAA